MGPNFDVCAPPTFVTEFSNKLESLNIKLVGFENAISSILWDSFDQF